MKLFSGIKKKETLEKVYRKLSQYPTLCLIAGEPYSPQLTATYSLMPKTRTNKPKSQTETLVNRKVDAELELAEIRRAVDEIPDAFYRQIIVKKYYRRNRDTDIAIYMDLGYSESEFYRSLEKAALLFAEAYRGGKLLVFENEEEFFGR